MSGLGSGLWAEVFRICPEWVRPRGRNFEIFVRIGIRHITAFSGVLDLCGPISAISEHRGTSFRISQEAATLRNDGSRAHCRLECGYSAGPIAVADVSGSAKVCVVALPSVTPLHQCSALLFISSATMSFFAEARGRYQQPVPSPSPSVTNLLRGSRHSNTNLSHNSLVRVSYLCLSALIMSSSPPTMSLLISVEVRL